MTPLCLLHGFAGGPSSWDAVVAHLAPSAAPLRLAVAGHLGAPDAMPPPIGFAHEVARLTRALPDERAHLCGYSLGGRLALAIAVAAPDRVARLTLIGARPGLPAAARAARLDADARWLSLLGAGDIDAFAAAWEAQPLFATEPDSPARAIRRRQDPLRLAAALDALGLARMPDLASGAACPTTVLAAAGDPVHAVAGASVRRVPGGHNSLVEAPAAVADALKETP